MSVSGQTQSCAVWLNKCVLAILFLDLLLMLLATQVMSKLVGSIN